MDLKFIFLLILIFLIFFVFKKSLKIGLFNKPLVLIVSLIGITILLVGDYNWFVMLKNEGRSEWDYQLLISGIICSLMVIISILLSFVFNIKQNQYWTKTFSMISLILVCFIIINFSIIDIFDIKSIIRNKYENLHYIK